MNRHCRQTVRRVVPTAVKAATAVEAHGQGRKSRPAGCLGIVVARGAVDRSGVLR